MRLPRGSDHPGLRGLYTGEHEQAFRRITDFVHDQTAAAIGFQLGHSGRKGSTKLMWEGIDEPLAEGNWPVVAPRRPLPAAANQAPRELTPYEMAEIRDEFVEPRAARPRRASTCSSCTAPTATCCPASCRP